MLVVGGRAGGVVDVLLVEVPPAFRDVALPIALDDGLSRAARRILRALFSTGTLVDRLLDLVVTPLWLVVGGVTAGDLLTVPPAPPDVFGVPSLAGGRGGTRSGLAAPLFSIGTLVARLVRGGDVLVAPSPLFRSAVDVVAAPAAGDFRCGGGKGARAELAVFGGPAAAPALVLGRAAAFNLLMGRLTVSTAATRGNCLVAAVVGGLLTAAAAAADVVAAAVVVGGAARPAAVAA
jgi:hypothetical protein